MKFIIIFLSLSAVAISLVAGLPVPLIKTGSEVRKNAHDVHVQKRVSTIYSRENLVVQENHHNKSIFGPSNQRLQNEKTVLEVPRPIISEKQWLVRRLFKEVVKSAHIKTSDAHKKAAEAHWEAHAVHTAAAQHHKQIGERIAAHDEKAIAEKHAKIARAHEKTSIHHINAAYPDVRRKGPGSLQALKSVIQSKLDSRKAKKSLKHAGSHA